MRIAYLVNQYPKVSHSFIRREILCLEKQGVEVIRYAVRGWDSEVVDAQDIEEKNKTKYLLRKGWLSLLPYVLPAFVKAPIRFLIAGTKALQLGISGEKSLPYYLIYFLEALVLRRWISNAQCTHLHVHFGTNSAQVAMLVQLLGKIPYSFTVHGPEEFDIPRSIHLREKAQYAKNVIAISSFGRSQLYRHIDYRDWPKVKVVRCGLEKSFYEIETGKVPDTNKLVCVGRLCEQKGQLLLVEAVKQLVSEQVPVHLVLAGDGEMRDEIELLIEKNNLSDFIDITGWISSDQVRDEILSSRALVLPSFAEGLPVVIMEAMVLRRPVLTTFIAGIPELVVDKENGWLFPAGSVNDLSGAIKDCLKTPVERLISMGDSGHERVLQRHDIEIEVRKLIEYFG
jgi:glycosyltransferase involved in cell wall biosynthesis